MRSSRNLKLLPVKLVQMKKEKPALTQPPLAVKPGTATGAQQAYVPQAPTPPQISEEASRQDPPGEDKRLAADETATQTTPPAETTPPEAAGAEAKGSQDASPESASADPASPAGPASQEASDRETLSTGDSGPVLESAEPVPVQEEPRVEARQAEAARVEVRPDPVAAPSRMPIVFALVALVAAGLSGWQVYEQRGTVKELRDELAQRLTSADVTVGELRALTRQGQEAIASMQGRLGGFDAKLAATEGQAAALEALYQEHARSRNDQVLAEVEQAINIAAQQLQLAGNFEAALIALEGADARLAMPDQAHLQALRKALIKDLDNVRAHPRVDVSGLALRLEILLAKVDTLPLAYEFSLGESAAVGKPVEAPPVDVEAGIVDQATGYMQTLVADMWEEVRNMIRLERLDHVDPALLAPAQSTFLRENVKIRLLTARLALLARDGRTYSADLAQARAWVERYFDTRQDEVKRVIADLTELESQSISAQPPTLEETFAALRIVQARTPAAPRVNPQTNSAAGSDTATANR